MKRLTVREVGEIRDRQIVQQGNRCALCGGLGVNKDPVLDHDHTTGAVRGTLHRSCNALLGKLENNHARFGVSFDKLPEFLHGAARYIQLHKTNVTGLIHPTHKTADEKRIAANRKRRVARAAKKAK